MSKEPSKKTCDKCGKPMVFLFSDKKDRWYACDDVPSWVNTKEGRVAVYQMHFVSCEAMNQEKPKPRVAPAPEPRTPVPDDIDELPF